MDPSVNSIFLNGSESKICQKMHTNHPDQCGSTLSTKPLRRIFSFITLNCIQLRNVHKSSGNGSKFGINCNDPVSVEILIGIPKYYYLFTQIKQ